MDKTIDASEEDLPMDWVKKESSDGSQYYFNVLTGAIQDHSPNDLGAGRDVGFTVSLCCDFSFFFVNLFLLLRFFRLTLPVGTWLSFVSRVND